MASKYQNWMKITYRPAANKDIPTIADFMESYYKTEGLLFVRQSSSRAVRYLLSNQSIGKLILIEVDSIPIGYYCLAYGFSLEYYGKDCMLDEIYIEPSFQRQGIGSKVLNDIAKDLKYDGFMALHIVASQRNRKAAKFYIKNGFSIGKNTFMTKRLKRIKKL